MIAGVSTCCTHTYIHTHTYTHTRRAFNPMWKVLKQMCEEIASIHANFVQQLTELSREIAEYNVAQRDKLKVHVRTSSVPMFPFLCSSSHTLFPILHAPIMS